MKKLMRSPVPRAQSLLSHQNRLPYSVRACLEKGQVAVDSDRNLGLVGRSTTFTWKTEGWVSRVYPDLFHCHLSHSMNIIKHK